MAARSSGQGTTSSSGSGTRRRASTFRSPQTRSRAELRRSLHDGIARDDLSRLIVLNARTLIERDADFTRFAARILLSYLYEEVLDWRIDRDGVGALRAAHVAAFRSLLERGVACGRIDEQLLGYDLDRLAAAIDPTADLDFDFLGVQTLYDRYLLVDKIGVAAGERSRPRSSSGCAWRWA